MASSSLSPYVDNTAQVTFNLVTTSESKTTYIVSGRAFAQPHSLEVTRKRSGGRSNDHIGLRMARVEPNATTNVLATGQIMVDISIPKDQSVITNDVLIDMLGALSSILNEGVALNAGITNRSALVEGRDL